MASQIDRAVAALRRGGVIAYPTEAVWGLGCDPLNQGAVARLFELKQRPQGQGVLLIGSKFEQFADFVGPCPASALARAKATWPGPNTWVFPRKDSVPVWIVGEHAGIALRVTDHPVARELCEALGSALISTSANRHGQAAARSAGEVREMFGDDLAEIVQGELGGLERPTPIRDAISGEWLRD
jgi:L-threonylcarbamoyladenylate synthase